MTADVLFGCPVIDSGFVDRTRRKRLPKPFLPHPNLQARKRPNLNHRLLSPSSPQLLVPNLAQTRTPRTALHRTTRSTSSSTLQRRPRLYPPPARNGSTSRTHLSLRHLPPLLPRSSLLPNFFFQVGGLLLP